VTRLAASLDGWGAAAVAVPAGRWTDRLMRRAVDSDGAVPLAGILDRLPVALLTKTHD
jgi:maltooligosyltrehalose synthase